MANFSACQHLGVDDGVDARLFEEGTKLGSDILAIVYACHRLLCPQLMGKHARGHIARLVGSHPDKEVGALCPCFTKMHNRSGRCYHRHNIHIPHEAVQLCGRLIQEGYFVLLPSKETGKVCTHGTCTGNDDFHNIRL